jgi:hypothetical protein
MTTRTNPLHVGLAALGIALAGCGRADHRQEPKRTSGDAIPLHLHIRSTIAGADLAYDTVYRRAGTPAFTVTDCRYYISHIEAIRDDGAAIPVSDTVVLVDPGRRVYEPGSLPRGVYRGVRFVVGLDSATNHGDPTVFAAGHPLAMQTPSMHWDWNSGYLFMKVEGRVDTTGKGGGVPATEFFYHFGTDAMKRTVDVAVRFAVGDSSAGPVRLCFDLGTMLERVDMRTETSTHSFDNAPLAAGMADRWGSAFSSDE